MKFSKKFVGLCLPTNLLAWQNSNEHSTSSENGILEVILDQEPESTQTQDYQKASSNQLSASTLHLRKLIAS